MAGLVKKPLDASASASVPAASAWAQTQPHAHHQLAASAPAIVDVQEEEEELECPICMDELDFTDRSFKPCTCNYQICRFCWHQLNQDGKGKCPACRRPYTATNIKFVPPEPEVLAKLIAEKKARERARKAAAGDARAALLGSAGATPSFLAQAGVAAGSGHTGRRSLGPLADQRVVQRNLVYITNLPVGLARDEILRRPEYFGQYGKISKVVVNPRGAQPGGTTSAYLTFAKPEHALLAIQCADGAVLDGRALRASFGTTKYCAAFMRGAVCANQDCMYLHQLGAPADTFTKEDMAQGKHLLHDLARHLSPAGAPPTAQPAPAHGGLPAPRPQQPTAPAPPATAAAPQPPPPPSRAWRTASQPVAPQPQAVAPPALGASAFPPLPAAAAQPPAPAASWPRPNVPPAAAPAIPKAPAQAVAPAAITSSSPTTPVAPAQPVAGSSGKKKKGNDTPASSVSAPAAPATAAAAASKKKRKKRKKRKSGSGTAATAGEDEEEVAEEADPVADVDAEAEAEHAEPDGEPATLEGATELAVDEDEEDAEAEQEAETADTCDGEPEIAETEDDAGAIEEVHEQSDDEALTNGATSYLQRLILAPDSDDGEPHAPLGTEPEEELEPFQAQIVAQLLHEPQDQPPRVHTSTHTTTTTTTTTTTHTTTTTSTRHPATSSPAVQNANPAASWFQSLLPNVKVNFAAQAAAPPSPAAAKSASSAAWYAAPAPSSAPPLFHPYPSSGLWGGSALYSPWTTQPVSPKPPPGLGPQQTHASSSDVKPPPLQDPAIMGAGKAYHLEGWFPSQPQHHSHSPYGPPQHSYTQQMPHQSAYSYAPPYAPPPGFAPPTTPQSYARPPPGFGSVSTERKDPRKKKTELDDYE